jgi:hypothetical protein
LAKNEEEYIKTLTYVGDNFRFNEFNAESATKLSEDECILVKELFDKCNKDGVLDTEFTDVFTDTIYGEKYDGMYEEGSLSYDLYEKLSYSFVVSWSYKAEYETFYLDLPTYDDNDFYEKDKSYITAQRYANSGSELYAEFNGSLQKVGTLEETQYRVIMDGIAYGFAAKISLNDDFADNVYALDSGEEQWYDGDKFFSSDLVTYYVKTTDPYRYLQKDTTDYEKMFNWVPYSETTHIVGLDVYMGLGSCKAYMFIPIDVSMDELLVEYGDGGSREIKSRSAMRSNKTLYVIEE